MGSSRITDIARKLKEQGLKGLKRGNLPSDKILGAGYLEVRIKEVEYLVSRNKEIRELFMTGEWTQVSLGKRFGLSQGQVRHILIRALSYEPKDTEVIDSSNLKEISRMAKREHGVRLEELLEDYDSFALGEKYQKEIASDRGITQGAVSWRLRHPLLEGNRPPLPRGTKFKGG